MPPAEFERAARFLAFRVVPTTVLVLCTCLVLFVALITTDVLPSVPQNQGGLNVTQAYEDLRQITARPHPYISHSNDIVRSYLLSRLLPIAEQYPHVHVSDDQFSDASWCQSTTGVYFEGTNILVKIDGTGSTDSAAAGGGGGVLFSAHYDSVATAPGSTDDGMGVVTLVQLVRYFAENRSLRTAVFNINNGEEDGLNGAHAFLEHPWSNLTDTFLNLEGAAAGGRAILFRAGSTPPARSFRSKYIPHPHANVVSSDAFARGLIRSSTDYSVYSGPRSSNPGGEAATPLSGMQGLDYAFYKGRSRYHTKYDSVPYTEGGKRSLWSMMEVARGSGIELLNAGGTAVGQGEVRDKDAPVYFDLFKSAVIVFPIINLLAFNIAMLILGPIILVSLVIWKYVILARQYESVGIIQHESGTSRFPPRFSRYFSRLRDFNLRSLFGSGGRDQHQYQNGVPANHSQSMTDWLVAIWVHIKFWVALIVTIGLDVLLVWLYIVVNPFAVYSSPYIVLLSFLCLTYLSLNFVLNFPTSLPRSLYSPKQIYITAVQDKQITFFHLYLLTWVFVVLCTVGITTLKPGLGGGYLMSAWNVCVGLGAVLVCVEGVVDAERGERGGGIVLRDDEEYEELEGEHTNANGGGGGEYSHAVDGADESTPLHPSQLDSRRRLELDKEEELETFAETWWWIPQFILSVPVPVILFSHVVTLILDAMPQTLGDGSPAVAVYALTTVLALCLVLPLSPFMSKLYRSRVLSVLVLVFFVLSVMYTWLMFPFSSANPLRVLFQQRVEIDLGLDYVNNASSSSSSDAYGPSWGPRRMITSLVGHPLYLPDSAIISNLPSAGKVDCKSHPTRSGLRVCEWDSGGDRMRPVPGAAKIWDREEQQQLLLLPEYFDARVVRTGPFSARIWVKGRNTRSCRVYFDSGPVFEYDVRRAGGQEKKGMQFGYEVGKNGVRELILWSRTWDREFVVDVGWGEGSGGRTSMEGRIACEWAEYESAGVDHGSGDGGGMVSGKIPAFEELLRSLPEWAVSSKQDDGLVEVLTRFSV